MMPTAKEVYADGLLMWYELCPEHRGLFERWRDAPNPAAWAKPEVQRYPQLLAWLASCRVLGPGPQEWRETVAWQLLGIRRDCTAHQPPTEPARAVEEVSLP